MSSEYNEYDSIFGNLVSGNGMTAPAPEKKEASVLTTPKQTEEPEKSVKSATDMHSQKKELTKSVQNKKPVVEQFPMKPTSKKKKKTESSVAMIRDFPRPLLNTVKAMFPAGNQTDALVAFVLHGLGEKSSHGAYEVPVHIQEMVTGADQGTLPGLKAEMTGIGGKLDKLYTEILMIQFLNVYGMLHDVGVRKRTEGLSQVDMLEDKMFEAMEIIRRDFPEFRQIIEDREHRNTTYFQRK